MELQNTGFIWDPVCNGKVFKDVEFVLFAPFFKVDTDEAEKLCGKCTSRTGNASQLCRCCKCPMNRGDRILENCGPKTQAETCNVVKKNYAQNLKNLSQHSIDNACHSLRFGLHNNQGIHGACPTEMLHAPLLGIFCCVRDCFFEQVGPTSDPANELNSLSQQCGNHSSRQSDQDLPKTRFNQGIRKGKLTAKEFPGVLLCSLCVLRSSKGHILLKRRAHFKNPATLEDWIMLIETLLQWEMWLKSPKMKKNHVQKAKEKHKVIVHLIKKIGKRVEGMGPKIFKCHAILHVADDILNFGVPLEFDTGSNEKGHKPTKLSAKLMQKNMETFDQQTVTRLEELHLLDLACEELAGGPPWRCCLGHAFEAIVVNQPEPPALGGSQFCTHWDKSHNVYKMAIVGRSRTKRIIQN